VKALQTRNAFGSQLICEGYLETIWRKRMELKPINLQEKLAKFSDHFSPKIIAQMNNYH
jgi:hypothetical protein